MIEQLLLNGETLKVYSFKEWFDMFVKHCEKIHFEKGEQTGAYCCSYHWCCDKCRQELNCGCQDCVKTMVDILKENGVPIDTSDIDFDNWEERAKKLL